jgi:type IV pilus assembly protein PilE
MKNKNAGFTLIELLVVVLIIGILAAIALPQYNKAVMKSRFSTLYAAVNAIAQAEEIYYLENGTYTTDMEALSINVPTGAAIIWNNPQTDNWAIYGQVGDVIEYLIWPKYSKVRTDKRVCRVYLNKSQTELAKSVCLSLKTQDSNIFQSPTYWEYFL